MMTANCAKLAGRSCRCTESNARPKRQQAHEDRQVPLAEGHFPAHLRVTDKRVRVHAKRAQLVARERRLRAKNEERAECPLVAHQVEEAIESGRRTRCSCREQKRGNHGTDNERDDKRVQESEAAPIGPRQRRHYEGTRWQQSAESRRTERHCEPFAYSARPRPKVR